MNLKKWIKRQFRKRLRVYIFPTRMGGYLNGLIFLMFLLSIGYNNNLLLIFTLFLFAFNLLWLLQSHFHLQRLKFERLNISQGHVGEALSVTAYWNQISKSPWEWKLMLESDNEIYPLEGSEDNEEKSLRELRLPRRGLYEWKYLKVSSENPFGLYRVWIYFPLKMKTLIYPALLKKIELNLQGEDLEGDILQDKKGQDDFRGLTQYGEEESRKISWKHYARSGELLIKEGENQKAPVLKIDLKIPRDESLKEHYLSYLATQMVECHRREIPFSLTDGKSVFMPAVHATHLHECLKVLALC